MKFKDLSITQKRKLAFALLKDKDRHKIFNFNSSSLSSSSIPFKFADIPTQTRELKQVLEGKNSPIDQKIGHIPGLINMIQGYANPHALRTDSNQELKREVDIWYNVMYRNKNEEGDDLETPDEIKEAKQRLLRRVGHISEWDVSRVTDMSYLFSEKTRFNDDISRWNVSNVTNMEWMFSRALDFNQSLNSWVVSNVRKMNRMFYRASRFNQSLNNWDVSNVTTMEWMFFFAGNFNQPLNNWNVSNVTIMGGMFLGASSFNQPLNNWDVSNVTTMNSMFGAARSFNQPLHNWSVSNVTNMSSMFGGASRFNQPLNNWERTQGVDGATSTSTLSNVTDMGNMFISASSFNQPLNNWNVSNVTNMESMFNNARSFNQPVNNWNVYNVTDMDRMFRYALSFNQPLNNWNVSNVTNMESMFDNARSFNQDLNTHEERKYDYTISLLFNNNRIFSKLDEKIRNSYVDSFTRNNITFQSLLNKENLIDFDTFQHYLKTNNIHMKIGHGRRLFRYLKILHDGERDVKGSGFNSRFPPIPYNSYTAWDVSNVTNMKYMFNGARSLEQRPRWYNQRR